MAFSSPAHAHNLQLLVSYGHTRDLRERNRLIEANLPLVRKVANQESRHTAVPFEDLFQQGCLGLIRALEAFETDRTTALSSFAVPYIRGAIRQHLRDKQPGLRCPRRLRELHARGQKLIQGRQHAGLLPLGPEGMAKELGCSPEDWQEAQAVHRALQVRSLDVPVGTEGEGQGSLLDQLAAPQAEELPAPEHPLAEAVRGLLEKLDPLGRQLVEGRVLYGASWRELGETLGLHGRMAQRRFEVLIEELRGELEPVLSGLDRGR